MCLGYRCGTQCKKVVRAHRHRGAHGSTNSWENYQLCSKCSKSEQTLEYRKSVLLGYREVNNTKKNTPINKNLKNY